MQVREGRYTWIITNFPRSKFTDTAIGNMENDSRNTANKSWKPFNEHYTSKLKRTETLILRKILQENLISYSISAT